MLLEELGQLKNPITSSGIKTEVFQLIEQCINQLEHCVIVQCTVQKYILRIADTLRACTVTQEFDFLS
jgi:hypothetical protein